MAFLSPVQQISQEQAQLLPSDPAVAARAREIDARIATTRDRILQTIRCHMPIGTIFIPEPKIDLGLFVKDQILMRQIAEHLMPLAQMEEPCQASVARHFQTFEHIADIRSMFKNNPEVYLSCFYQACVAVVLHQSVPNLLEKALQGRIFTLRNALIAQEQPEMIRRSQEQNGLPKQELSAIKEEGASFIRETLRFHFDSLSAKQEASFREQLTSSAAQLIPFVQKVTRLYLLENSERCPDNPLTFRNPTGYNRHGIVAATIMGACLSALGFEIRIMVRTDLEPTVTLATLHSIVEVTSPEKLRYVVDPTYIQFFKDIYAEDSALPASPVLIMEEKDLDSYVERNLMTEWRRVSQLLHVEGEERYQKLLKNDQHLLYVLDQYELPRDRNFVDSESWVRKALARVWELSSYYPVHVNLGFQEIFWGEGAFRKTFEKIRALGIASLTPYQSSTALERQLEQRLRRQELLGKNDPETLSLLAQLQSDKRIRFASLLDLDPRIDGMTGLTPLLNAYFCSLRNSVNPNGEDKRVVYGCSGADSMSVLLSTDASEIACVDLTRTTYQEFIDALELLKDESIESEFAVNSQLMKSRGFFNTSVRFGGATSFLSHDGKHHMPDLALKLLFGLRGIGVDLDKVVVQTTKDELRITFPWRYHGSAASRQRCLKFLTADITKPEEYPDSLKERLSAGIDIFYMKAAFFVPLHYAEFLPQIAESIREDGWLMTADKTLTMEPIKPESCLRGKNQTFVMRKRAEVRMFEELMQMPLNPFSSIDQLHVHGPEERAFRMPGSDYTYWTILNLRQKTCHH